MKEQHLKRLFALLQLNEGVLFRDFRKCFTHISVYEGKNDFKNPGNSRYVFLGMYAFRGYLAELINTYVSGNGKQLQHYLGNVFSNDRLAAIFDELELQHCLSIHEKLDSNKLKHVFTYALLGFIQQNATEEFKQDFAFRYFLKGTENSLPKSHRINEVQALKAKTKEVLSERISFINTHEIVDQKTLYKTQVLLTSGGVIGEHESVSKTYAKKKAVKNAFRYVLEKEAATPEYQRFAEKKQISDNEKVLREKAERQKQHEAFITKKKVRRTRVKAEKKALAQEREFQRVLTKKSLKTPKEPKVKKIKKEIDKRK